MEEQRMMKLLGIEEIPEHIFEEIERRRRIQDFLREKNSHLRQQQKGRRPGRRIGLGGSK